MYKIEIHEQDLNNLMLLLDRIQYDVLKEVQAINQISQALINKESIDKEAEKDGE